MSIKIKEKNKEIAKKIEKAILQELYKILRAKADAIKQEIIRENLNIWKETETYHSLISGKLTHEFGIPEGTAQQRVDFILDVFGRSISVIPKLTNRKKAGNYILLDLNVFSKAIKQGIFTLPEAIVITDKEASNDLSGDFGAFGATSIRKELPWLRWLLYEGNKYIIYGYEYRDIVSERSRSGKGLMVHSDSNWKVPAEFSGTKNSHWLIRALEDNRQFLINRYGSIIEKHIKSA